MVFPSYIIVALKKIADFISYLFFTAVTYRLKCRGYFVYGFMHRGKGLLKALVIDSLSLKISLRQIVKISEGLLSTTTNYRLSSRW